MKMLPLIFLLMTFISCGSDDDDLRFGPQEEQAAEPSGSEFATRLTNTLSISGRECLGNEIVMVGEGETVTCEKPHWIITIDQVNTCAEGSCTETFIFPFVGVMRKDFKDDGFEYFSIQNVTEIPPETTGLMMKYWVRFNRQDPVVIEKF